MRGVLLFLIAILVAQAAAQLHIIGANYGGRDVTNRVRAEVRDNKLRIGANNGVFGDPRWGVRKSLVVAFRFGNSVPEVHATLEGGVIYIAGDNGMDWERSPGDFVVFGAFYAAKDVSGRLAQIANNGDKVRATNGNFGDPLWGYPKTLCVCYADRKENIKFQCTWEGSWLYL
jgi:hypothetical protein